ncbi:MAG: hypothetical protein ABI440_15540 [Casimicrobiaceae bacterium]
MKNSLSVFRRIAQLAVCGFTIALPALATDTHGNLPPDGTIGLLDAPALMGTGACTQRSGAKYILRSAPSANAPSVGTLEAQALPAGQHACSEDALVPRVRKPGDPWPAPVPVREFAPGRSGLIAIEQRPGWARILLGNGDAWLALPPGAGLHDYGHLGLLTQPIVLPAWDGRVCERKSLESCHTVALPSRTFRINRTESVGADLWFQVEFGLSACDGPAKPGQAVVRGWIPGYGRAGLFGRRALTTWWRPRGC